MEIARIVLRVNQVKGSRCDYINCDIFVIIVIIFLIRLLGKEIFVYSSLFLVLTIAGYYINHWS